MGMRCAPTARAQRSAAATMDAANTFSASRRVVTESPRPRAAAAIAGCVMPSAFAVLRLITSSNFVGCSTGRSAGFAPLRILSTQLGRAAQADRHSDAP